MPHTYIVCTVFLVLGQTRGSLMDLQPWSQISASWVVSQITWSHFNKTWQLTHQISTFCKKFKNKKILMNDGLNEDRILSRQRVGKYLILLGTLGCLGSCFSIKPFEHWDCVVVEGRWPGGNNGTTGKWGTAKKEKRRERRNNSFQIHF